MPLSRTAFIHLIFAFLILTFAMPSSAEELNNKEAMKGLKSVHVIYDIRKSNPNSLLVFLKGIESNRNDLIKEGVEPYQRIIFIGQSVKFITTKPSEEVDMEFDSVLKDVANQVAHLIKLGVKMEACSNSIAAFGVDKATMLPGIKVVRSGFVSLMGWQAQGYQLVPIYD